MGSRMVRAGGAVGQEAAGVSEKVLVLSQNRVLKRSVEQILDDKVVDRVQQRFVEQDLEAPCVVLVEVWRGSVAPFSVVFTLLTLSHLETWTLFLQAPYLADTCPRVMRQSTEVLEEFLELSCVKVFSDPEVDSVLHLQIWNYIYEHLVSGPGLLDEFHAFSS